MVPHSGARENNQLFCGFLKTWELNVECVVVDKTRTTYGHGLMDLRTYWQYTDCITKCGPVIHGPLDKPRTYNSRTWQTMDLLFTDFPSKTSRSVASVPWITSEIRRNIRKRNKTHAKAKKTGSSKLRSKFQEWDTKSKLISRSSMICMLTNWLVTLRLTQGLLSVYQQSKERQPGYPSSQKEKW